MFGEMKIRPIAAADVNRLFDVRVSVRENAVTRDELACLGITPASTIAAVSSGELSGFLCEVVGVTVGFALANVRTQELAVIAVLPEFERRGIGRELLQRTEGILWNAGCDSIWLWTSPAPTRAIALYERNGWTEREVKDGRRYMTKQTPTPRFQPPRASVGE
jgi:ribosomal protein S18 acetylase RimI-like enzyme